MVLLCLHVAVPEFSAHATVSSSSSQSSGYSNICRSSYVMLERLVISLSYLIHVFIWIDSCVFNPIYHSLGDVSYHLGPRFLAIILLLLNDQRLKAWFSVEDIPAEQASFRLPVRYPDDLT